LDQSRCSMCRFFLNTVVLWSVQVPQTKSVMGDRTARFHIPSLIRLLSSLPSHPPDDTDSMGPEDIFLGDSLLEGEPHQTRVAIHRNHSSVQSGFIEISPELLEVDDNATAHFEKFDLSIFESSAFLEGDRTSCFSQKEELFLDDTLTETQAGPGSPWASSSTDSSLTATSTADGGPLLTPSSPKPPARPRQHSSFVRRLLGGSKGSTYCATSPEEDDGIGQANVSAGATKSPTDQGFASLHPRDLSHDGRPCPPLVGHPGMSLRRNRVRIS